MKLLIELPDRYIAVVMQNQKIDGSAMDKLLRQAVIDGTPLPKGHGRLIDANDLLNRIGLEDNDSNREDNVGEIITLEDFDFIPTIIEADKVEGKVKE